MKKKPTKKKTSDKRQRKPSTRLPRKVIERPPLPITLASELRLRCRQYRRGTIETCGNPATVHIVGLGDGCDACAGGRPVIRYATERETAKIRPLAA